MYDREVRHLAAALLGLLALSGCDRQRSVPLEINAFEGPLHAWIYPGTLPGCATPLATVGPGRAPSGWLHDFALDATGFEGPDLEAGSYSLLVVSDPSQCELRAAGCAPFTLPDDEVVRVDVRSRPVGDVGAWLADGCDAGGTDGGVQTSCLTAGSACAFAGEPGICCETAGRPECRAASECRCGLGLPNGARCLDPVDGGEGICDGDTCVVGGASCGECNAPLTCVDPGGLDCVLGVRTSIELAPSGAQVDFSFYQLDASSPADELLGQPTSVAGGEELDLELTFGGPPSDDVLLCARMDPGCMDPSRCACAIGPSQPALAFGSLVLLGPGMGGAPSLEGSGDLLVVWSSAAIAAGQLSETPHFAALGLGSEVQFQADIPAGYSVWHTVFAPGLTFERLSGAATDTLSSCASCRERPLPLR